MVEVVVWVGVGVVVEVEVEVEVVVEVEVEVEVDVVVEVEVEVGVEVEVEVGVEVFLQALLSQAEMIRAEMDSTIGSLNGLGGCECCISKVNKQKANLDELINSFE